MYFFIHSYIYYSASDLDYILSTQLILYNLDIYYMINLVEGNKRFWMRKYRHIIICFILYRFRHTLIYLNNHVNK